MRLSVAVAIALSLVPQVTLAQSIPLFRGTLPVVQPVIPVAPPPPAPFDAPPSEPVADGRSRPKWLFPLIDQGKDAVKEFYGQTSQITPLSQVKFLQALGVASKLLSADMTSVLFPGGFRVAVWTSVSAANVDDDHAQNSAEELKERALNRLNGGGDLFLTIALPAIAAKGTYGSFYTFVLPKFGFGFPGFSASSTSSEATEVYTDISGESYGEFRAFSDDARVFGDLKWGYLRVPDTFAAAIGLREVATTNQQGTIVLGAIKHSTLLAQVSAGIEFSGFLRISAQRFVGGDADAFAPPDGASKWRVSIQVAPRKP